MLMQLKFNTYVHACQRKHADSSLLSFPSNRTLVTTVEQHIKMTAVLHLTQPISRATPLRHPL